MSRSIPPAALALLAAMLVLAALPPIGVDLAPNASAGHAMWEKTTRLPTRNHFMSAVWDGTGAYLFGGNDAQGTLLGTILRYEPATDTLTPMDETLSPARDSASAVWDGTHAYLFGGRSSGGALQDILRYDPASDSVMPMGEVLPGPAGGTSAVWDPRPGPDIGCAEGCAYIFGGENSGAMLDQILRYDPLTDTVTTMNERLPAGRAYTSAVWAGTAAYVLGGQIGGGAGVNEILRYDPVTDVLTPMTAVLSPSGGAAATLWDGTAVYLIGGSAGVCLDRIVRYDPQTDVAVNLAIRVPFAAYGAAAAWDGTSAYLFGGHACNVATLDTIVRFPIGTHPPVSVISPVPVVECVEGRGTVPLRGTASFDPEGTAVTYLWWSPGDMVVANAAAGKTSASVPYGPTPVKLTVTDAEGLKDTATGTARVVDTQPPSTTATPVGSAGEAGWWRSAVDVTLLPTDGCGIATTYHGVDGMPSEEGTIVTVEDDGSHVVEYRSVDLGGNTGPTGVLPLFIDKTRPDVAILDPESGNAYLNDVEDPADDPLPLTIVAGTKAVTANATDVTSGVERVEFHVDGGLRATVFQAPYQFVWNAGDEAAGNHVLAARAYDVAGNNATAEMNVQTVPTTPQGVVRTTDFGNACRLVLGPAQCVAFEESIEQLDPAPTVDLVRDAINTFLERCEETLSRTICALLPDELPSEPAIAPGRAPPERDPGDAPADGAVAMGEGGEPE